MSWKVRTGKVSVEQLNLMEGYARLGQLEAARQELSQTLSRVTTLGSSTMTSLKRAGLL